MGTHFLEKEGGRRVLWRGGTVFHFVARGKSPVFKQGRDDPPPHGKLREVSFLCTRVGPDVEAKRGWSPTVWQASRSPLLVSGDPLHIVGRVLDTFSLAHFE